MLEPTPAYYGLAGFDVEGAAHAAGAVGRVVRKCHVVEPGPVVVVGPPNNGLAGTGDGVLGAEADKHRSPLAIQSGVVGECAADEAPGAVGHGCTGVAVTVQTDSAAVEACRVACGGGCRRGPNIISVAHAIETRHSTGRRVG